MFLLKAFTECRLCRTHTKLILNILSVDSRIVQLYKYRVPEMSSNGWTTKRTTGMDRVILVLNIYFYWNTYIFIVVKSF